MENENELLEFGNEWIEKNKEAILKAIDYYYPYEDDDENNITHKEENFLKRSDKCFYRLEELSKQKIDLTRENIDMILEIIGQMYKGVLITNQISIRKGRIYPYKRQYDFSSCNSQRFKQLIMDNIFEVAKKIGESNLDVLEYILERMGSVENEEKDKNKIIRFPKVHTFITFNKYSKVEEIQKGFPHHIELAILKINGIRINERGWHNFCYLDDDNNERSVDLSFKQENCLFKKYGKEIKEGIKGWEDEKQKKIENLQKANQEIKDKGSSLLILATLKKENEGGLRC